MIDERILQEIDEEDAAEKQKATLKTTRICITVIMVSIIIIAVCFAIWLVRWISNTSFRSALNDVEIAIRNTYQNNCSISTSGHTVTIEVWSKGVVNEAVKAAEGDQHALKEWQDTQKNMEELARIIYDKFILADNVVIYFSLMNDDNPERKLMSFKNKLLTYDAVTGYNIGG